mgnify:FL=1
MKYTACAACKLEYPEGTKFCQKCGGALTELQRVQEHDQGQEASGLSSFLKKFNPASVKKLRGKKGLLVGGVIAGVFFLGSASAYFFDNPQGELNSMISAIKNKDLGQLGNESLFPNPENLPLPTKEFLSVLQTNQSQASINLDWEPGFSTARAEVIYEDGGKFEVSFKSSLGFWGPFLGRSWQVDSEATSFELKVGDAVPGTLPIKFGEESFELSALVPEGKRQAKFLSFPGSLDLLTQESGIYGAGSVKSEVVTQKATELTLDENQLTLAKAASRIARTEVDNFVTKCVNRECSSLPYIDINWSPRSPSFFYDFRSRSDSYSKGSCTVDRWKATSETSAKVIYSCDISLTATELQVTYYYYFSDDYDYYFGSGSGEMKVEVDVSANANGEGFKAGKVRTTN